MKCDVYVGKHSKKQPEIATVIELKALPESGLAAERELDRDNSNLIETESTLASYHEHNGFLLGELSKGRKPPLRLRVADIAHSAKGYESEDENAGRRRQRAADERPPSKTTMYSKQEFREQYCINNKQLDLLELEKSKKERFLGCLSQYHIESPCSRANSVKLLRGDPGPTASTSRV
ncbi:hypothetical protein EVAR_83114_1 [Eumeta japonica]|uniref:Uncharacterized protein n=1 Tax=Eumeta variegata TaxID=151549 RepID=A0A4C1WMK6_EUMVA|nr:hypothetical protein EVAR_83114_1 [Eumeta japonica]